MGTITDEIQRAKIEHKARLRAQNALTNLYRDLSRLAERCVSLADLVIEQLEEEK